MFDNAHIPDDEASRPETNDDGGVFAEPLDVAPDPDVRAEVVERDDGLDELTVSPADAEGFDRMTTWITAREGSYVSLGEMR